MAVAGFEFFAARYRTWTLRPGCSEHRVEWQRSLDLCCRPTLYAPCDDGERNGEVSASDALDARYAPCYPTVRVELAHGCTKDRTSTLETTATLAKKPRGFALALLSSRR